MTSKRRSFVGPSVPDVLPDASYLFTIRVLATGRVSVFGWLRTRDRKAIPVPQGREPDEDQGAAEIVAQTGEREASCGL